jgi:hypothetical protein
MIRRAALALVLAVGPLIAAACTTSPVQFGTLPVEGYWIMGANVLACAPATGPIKVEMDFATVEPDWARAVITDNTTGQVGWLSNTAPRHWEWTSAPVAAGSCWTFTLSSGCRCCDPCPPTVEFGFHYRISQVL